MPQLQNAYEDPIKIVYVVKGYTGAPNRSFHSLNHIVDSIMREDIGNAALTDAEIQRNNAIFKKGYIVEQYLGISTLHDVNNRACYVTFDRTRWGVCCPLFCRLALTFFIR